MMQVAVEQQVLDLRESRVNGLGLTEDVDAVAVVIHHLHDAAEVPLHGPQAGEDLLLSCRVVRWGQACHALTIAHPPRGGYMIQSVVSPPSTWGSLACGGGGNGELASDASRAKSGHPSVCSVTPQSRSRRARKPAWSMGIGPPY